MASNPKELPDGEQLTLLRRLAKIYAFCFDQEQPTICDIRFMDACVAYWTLCDIDSLDQLSSLSAHVGYAIFATANLFGSNDGFMGRELVDLCLCDQYTGLSGWLEGISGLCRGSLRAPLPVEPRIAEWIACRGDSDWRRGLIEDATANELPLYTTMLRSDLTIGHVAPEWPVTPTILGICGYFEALLHYKSWCPQPDGDTGTWRRVPLEVRFEDILTWLNIERPKGLVNEPMGWRTERV